VLLVVVKQVVVLVLVVVIQALMVALVNLVVAHLVLGHIKELAMLVHTVHAGAAALVVGRKIIMAVVRLQQLLGAVLVALVLLVTMLLLVAVLVIQMVT
jgi:hypothetical protein